MTLPEDILWQAATFIATAASVYGGIRADLKAQREAINIAHETAVRAHRRLDDHIDHPKP